MNYYIKGSPARAKEIEAAFEKLGYNRRGLDFSCGFFYTVERDVNYCVSYDCVVNIIKTHPDYQELELPKPHYGISNFKPFDKVLVRQDDSCTWGISFFGRYAGMFICCSNGCFVQCVPFKGNEHLLGTTDMCDECYINW